MELALEASFLDVQSLLSYMDELLTACLLPAPCSAYSSARDTVKMRTNASSKHESEREHERDSNSDSDSNSNSDRDSDSERERESERAREEDLEPQGWLPLLLVRSIAGPNRPMDNGVYGSP